jgi:endonuclease-3
MSRAPSRLQTFIGSLEAFYGPLAKPAATDPLEMILWENIAYLADDARRVQAWETFRKRIGTTPEEILAAPRAELMTIARAGILAADRLEKVREIAEIALHEFGGDLNKALDDAPKGAKKALKKFPSIGDPGAEKILLFSRREPVLALDSNGLRVLLRLGYGKKTRITRGRTGPLRRQPARSGRGISTGLSRRISSCGSTGRSCASALGHAARRALSVGSAHTTDR